MQPSCMSHNAVGRVVILSCALDKCADNAVNLYNKSRGPRLEAELGGLGPGGWIYWGVFANVDQV